MTRNINHRHFNFLFELPNGMSLIGSLLLPSFSLAVNYILRRDLARVWWPIVANLNFNHQRNLKPQFHYNITLKFKTEIKYEIDFYYYVNFAFHLFMLI